MCWFTMTPTRSWENLKCAPGSTILDLYAANDEPDVYLVEKDHRYGKGRSFVMHYALFLHKRLHDDKFDSMKSNAIAEAMIAAYDAVITKKDKPIV